MSDDNKELLHLAAKAYGLTSGYKWRDLPGSGFMREPSDSCEADQWWNPLKSDGDALRLAVKLGFVIDTLVPGQIQFKDVNPGSFTRVISGSRHPKEGNWHHGEHGDDPFYATRRAIVRAAAGIGKLMP